MGWGMFWESYPPGCVLMAKNQIRKLVPTRKLTGRPLLGRQHDLLGHDKTGSGVVNNSMPGHAGQTDGEMEKGAFGCKEPVAVNPVRERCAPSYAPPPGYSFQLRGTYGKRKI